MLKLHKNITKPQIDEFVDELEEREMGAAATTVVVMGGEPTLMPEEFEYLIERLILSTKKNNKAFYCTYITNAVRLHDQQYYDDFLKLVKHAHENRIIVHIEISYDGVGHSLRNFHNGESSQEMVEGVLKRLTNDGVGFNISYTVTEENYDKLVEESILIFETHPTIHKLIFSFDYKRLDDFLRTKDIKCDMPSGRGDMLKNEYKPYMTELYKIYNKPICPMVCGSCGECHFDLYDGLHYMSPSKGVLFDEYNREINLDGVFDRF